MLRATWDEADEVLAVHEDGSVVGPVDRIEAHAGEGVLHQAFETFLVEGTGDDARLLLCRRSALKRCGEACFPIAALAILKWGRSWRRGRASLAGRVRPDA